ncbi:MAG: sugar phosphate isomerase/epimerase [Verrucomicrobiota bacterium]
MRLGIFAKTFSRPTLAETLDAVVAHGFNCIQYNFACAGLPSMPEIISPELAAGIQNEMKKRNLTMAAVSGTFNMIHPDLETRRDGLRRLTEMVASCSHLGTSVVTLCTGTRDAENMWRHHPENDSPVAWLDLLATVASALEISEKFHLTLGIEPETGNVICSARKARQLLDEIKSPHLKIIFDAANLFHPGELPRQREILDEAFDLLGNEIVSAHAKDVREVNGTMHHVAAGKGDLDYDYYLSKLREAKFSGPLILHGLEENEVKDSTTFLKERLERGRPACVSQEETRRRDACAPIQKGVR